MAANTRTPIGLSRERSSSKIRAPTSSISAPNRRGPGSQRISEAEELRRLVPVLKRLRDKLTIPISVDTYKSGVADKALEHGAEIINDPSGILLDAQLPKVVTKYDAGLIINHMRGTPETWAKLPPLKDVTAFHRDRSGSRDTPRASGGRREVPDGGRSGPGIRETRRPELARSSRNLEYLTMRSICRSRSDPRVNRFCGKNARKRRSSRPPRP